VPTIRHLETIRAAVTYWPEPRTEVALLTADQVATELQAYDRHGGRSSQWHLMRKGVEARYIRLGPLALEAQGRDFTPHYLDEHPDFWREVLALSHAFRREDWFRIRGFYQTSGPLGYPNQELKGIYGEVPPDLEPYGWAAAVLSWFQDLVSLVDWCKQGQTGPLRDVLGRAEDKGGARPVYFHKGPVGYDIRFLPWSQWEGDRLIARGPRTDAEVIWAGWSAAQEAISHELGKASLALQETVVNRSVRTPTLFWGFAAIGKAFEAAFLQWFFQEVAYVDVRDCPVCGSHSFESGRPKYCSPKCARRAKKRQDRARIKLVRELLARREPPARIVTEVKDQLGIQTSEAAVRRLQDKGTPG
jgi:hypothetical protein